ncbi:MAG: putative metallopeptidase [Candidatus Aenigmatarchaeota archaeon]
MISYSRDPELEVHLGDIARKLGMNHVDMSRVICIRSQGSKSRYVLARCHTLPRIVQTAFKVPAHYLIEIISENFDKLSPEEQTKTLIHELCLPEDEWIVLKNEGGLEIKQIGEFIEKEFNSANIVNKTDDVEWIVPNSEYKALSYDLKNHEVVFAPITKLMRRLNKEKTVIKIITRDGRKIKVSRKHPLLYTKNPYSYDNTKYKVKVKICPAKDITNLKGIPRLLELFALPELEKNISKINLEYLLKNTNEHNLTKKSGRGNIVIENGFIRRRWVKGIKIPLKFKLDRELGQFFGFYLSEGSIDNKSGAVSFSFGSKEKQYKDFVKQILEKRFCAKPKERTLHNGTCTVIYANDKLLQFVIRDVFGFGEKSHHKKVPGFVYYAPLEFISGLLDGWFAGDGWTSYMKKYKSVYLSAFSKSPRLIFGILLLLSKLKVVGGLRRNQHDIRIQTYFLPRFYKHCKTLIKANNVHKFVKKIKPMKHIQRFKHTRCIRIRKVESESYKGKYFYNMEIETHNNFMHASGIFTHNCHIPKSFGGGFRHHRPYVNRRTVERMYKLYKEARQY